MQTYREIHKNVILEEFNILYQSMTEFIGKNKDTKVVDENREKLLIFLEYVIVCLRSK